MHAPFPRRREAASGKRGPQKGVWFGSSRAVRGGFLLDTFLCPNKEKYLALACENGIRTFIKSTTRAQRAQDRKGFVLRRAQDERMKRKSSIFASVGMTISKKKLDRLA
jgi:hypothetical protein